MASPHYHLFDAAIGTCAVSWSPQGICAVQLPERTIEATERRLRTKSPDAVPGAPPVPVREAIAAIQSYLVGNRTDFTSVLLDLHSIGAFDRGIYTLTRAVPWGETTTYGELARRAGAPDAARAVGQAMGSNPVPIIIPCHRVLASGRKIGGFSAFGGAFTKEKLLALEGIGPDQPLLPFAETGESRWG